MSIEDILLALDGQCREECQEIFNRAQEEAKQILEKARADADIVRKERLEKVEEEAESETISLLYSARLKAKNTVIRAREEMAERALHEAEQRLQGLRSRDDYPSVLEGLLREGLSRVGEKAVVHVDRLDKELAGSLLDGWGTECELHADINTLGGAVISDGGEKVRIVNTVEERLNRAREKLRVEVYNILFGEEEAAAGGG